MEKYTMKKIYNILLAGVVMLAFAPLSIAQQSTDIPFPADNTIKFAPDEWNKTYEIDEESGVGYRKIISQPNTKGVYHILLEEFVTGREIKIRKSLPADIVLVLDVSGSMNDGYGTDQVYTPATTPANGWSYSNTDNNYYVEFEGEYYNLSRGNYSGRGISASQRRYYFYFTGPEGQQYYLYQDRIIAATRQITGRMSNPEYYVTVNNNAIYTGTLYRGAIPSKLQSLKDAVLNFIDIIDENDTEHAPAGQERLGNRIAIVTFSGSAEVAIGFTPLSDKGSLVSTVRGLTANGATYADEGMSEAYDLLKASDSQLKTTVLFTDGIPGYYGSWTQYGTYYRTETWRVANNTIDTANDIKNLKVDSDDPTKQVLSNVFTVSVIVDPEPYTNVYLGKTSSNYLGATSMGSYGTWNSSNIWSNGNGTRNTSETNFALSASSASQLENAFATIAAASGGSSAALGEASISTVDIVSASFNLPAGTQASNIRVYTAACTGLNGTQPTFGSMILAPNREDMYQPMKKGADGVLQPDGPEKKVDGSITCALDGNKITVEGFDFSNLWCGEIVENEQHKGWHGYKVSMLIPIKMNPDALGGVGVDTNAEGSGIFINGENQFPFTSPKVNLPVNIVINKRGLDEGESAKFTIWRKTATEAAWEPVTSVFVTRHKNQDINAPRTRIEGMPATNASGVEYIYKVSEDDWSWSYTLTSDKELTTENTDNPFTFTNKKKNIIDTKIRHAESKVTNTFKTGAGATYDDSKGNGRKVIGDE